MSHHPTHNMHAHSLATYATLDISEREAQVLSALDALGGIATDKAIARHMIQLFPELGDYDPNLARPRVTGLIGKKVLRSCGRDLSEGRPQRLVERVEVEVAR